MFSVAMGIIRRQYFYKFYLFPGASLTQDKQVKLVGEMKEVAAKCFNVVPEYQALSGEQEILNKCVIMTVRDSNHKMLGFCSSLLIDSNGSKLLHLGLTCILPQARNSGLTHKLTSKLILKSLMRLSPFKKIYISNLACVLSSLVNVSTHFDDVFPSDCNPNLLPPLQYLHFADILSTSYRSELAINLDAGFDKKTFVFTGSVKAQEFQKESSDIRFHHRNKEKNTFYLNRLDFARGDEQLQIGKVGFSTFLRYIF